MYMYSQENGVTSEEIPGFASLSLNIRHGDSREKQSTSLTDWRQKARDACTKILLQTAHRDRVETETWGDAPDHGKSDPGKLAPPPKGNEDPTQRRQYVITTVLSAVKTTVAGFPHAVYAVSPCWFGQNILKAHLNLKYNSRSYVEASRKCITHVYSD